MVGWQARRHLPRCLASLAHQRHLPDEVFYVDNGSTDGSVECVRETHPDVRVLELGANRGFAAGNNAAIRQTRTDLVALLNPDAEATPGWLAALLTAATNAPDSVAGFASRIHWSLDPTWLQSAGDSYSVVGTSLPRGFGDDPARYLTAGPVFGPAGAAALFRRDALLAVDLFDESFFAYYEDADLALRLNLAGYSCQYVPAAVVRHTGQSSLGADSPALTYLAQRNLEWAYLKGMPASLLLRHLPARILFVLLGLAHFTRAGQLGTFLRAKAAATAALPRVLAARRRVQGERRLPVRELARRLEGAWLEQRLGYQRARRNAR